ncbi:hypothetical protein [Actinosynnema sp. NPDC020468]|uniref:fibronectin type III domain-containing protein n=1 Tax=Actinosynnema sp. NPDC020468 TaxID=3154488 RepID=UPI0033C4B3E8
MDRRRIAVIAAAVVLFGGAVAVLRTTGAPESPTTATTSAPPPTSLAPFAGEGVLVPTPGAPPTAPTALSFRAGPHRLQVRWTGEAPGYEVRWGRDGLDRSTLTTRNATELNGLDDDVQYTVEVRAVDAFGQRSEPARGAGTPQSSRVDAGFVDRFDQPNAPDPTRWRLSSRPNCARATPGRDDDGRRLVLSSNCASAPAVLRSRAPFVLHDGAGRFLVDTDGPGLDGELLVDLAPGPFSAVPGDPLPPGVLRLRVASGGGTSTVEVLTAEGTPTTAVRAVPLLEPGITHRWELLIRPDGVSVVLDGSTVATSTAVARWSEATALLSVSGPTGQRVAVSLVAFDAGALPPYVPSPKVDVVVAAKAAEDEAGQPVAGVTGGQLRLTLLHSDTAPSAPDLSVVVGGVSVPLRPAVAGEAWRSGYAAVADLPKEAVRVVDGTLHATVVSTLRVQVSHVDLELAGTFTGTPPSTDTAPLGGVERELARATGSVLDAAGHPVPEGTPVQRGRLVLDLVLDASGPVAGLAGFTVRVDGDRVASVPTTAAGPAVAGRWRLAVNTGALSAGPHLVEVRLFGTSADTRPTSAFVPFFVAQ